MQHEGCVAARTALGLVIALMPAVMGRASRRQRAGHRLVTNCSEAMRALKRRISDAVYRQLLSDTRD